jgi:hypothetical protein
MPIGVDIATSVGDPIMIGAAVVGICCGLSPIFMVMLGLVGGVVAELGSLSLYD